MQKTTRKKHQKNDKHEKTTDLEKVSRKRSQLQSLQVIGIKEAVIGGRIQKKSLEKGDQHFDGHLCLKKPAIHLL